MYLITNTSYKIDMKTLITSIPICMSNDSRDFISMRVAPTTAIYLLAAVALKEGIDIALLDPYEMQLEVGKHGLRETIKSKMDEFDVICLSSNTLNWSNTVKVIKEIRELYGKNKVIVLGGIHPTYFYEHIINDLEVDYILRGEGEVSFPKFLKCLVNKSDLDCVEGLVRKKCEGTTTNQKVPIIDDETYKKLPLPEFDLMPKGVYNLLPVETSRGCKYNCAFCSVPHRNNWRAFDEKVVIDRGTQIISKHIDKVNTKQVFITDDCLTADFERAGKIMDKLMKIDEEILFGVETRATDWLKPNVDIGIRTFGSSQISRLQFGVECGYNEGLKKISKGLTVELLEETVAILEKNNMLSRAYFSFIVGFPWETMDDCLKTVDFAAYLENRCGRLGCVNVNWLQIYPSNIWRDREKYGIVAEPDIFDDEMFIEDKYYELFHPTLSRSEHDYVVEQINKYENIGIYLRNY